MDDETRAAMERFKARGGEVTQLKPWETAHLTRKQHLLFRKLTERCGYEPDEAMLEVLKPD